MAEEDQNQQTALTASSRIDDIELTPLEQLISKVGGAGKYQFVSFMIFNCLWFFTGLTLTGQAFFFNSTFKCHGIPDQQKCTKHVCSLDPKDQSSAISEHADSITFAFEGQFMICSHGYVKAVLQSLTYAGSLLGFFVIPYFADNWGRKKAMLASWAVYAIGVAFVAFANSVDMVGVGLLLAGFGCNPAVTLCYSFLNEQCLGKKRQRYSVAIQVALAFGECVIALLFLPGWSWRIVFYMMLGGILLVEVFLFYLVESPKFLFHRGNTTGTLGALNTIARKNNKQEIVIEEVLSIEVPKHRESYSITALFKYKSLRLTAVGTSIGFFAIQVIYYGTILNLTGVGYDLTISQQIIGISEGLGYFAVELIVIKLKRKKWSILGMIASSGFCFVLALLGAFKDSHSNIDMKLVETIVLFISRFLLCSFWALFYVYIAELYPTSVRSLGFGLVSAVGQVGSVLAPYLVSYSSTFYLDPWILFGIIGLAASFTLFCLRETKGVPLIDEIQETLVEGFEFSDDERSE